MGMTTLERTIHDTSWIPRQTAARACESRKRNLACVLRAIPGSVFALLLLISFAAGSANAQDDRGSDDSFTSPQDPTSRVEHHRQFEERENLISFSALEGLYEKLGSARSDFYKSTGVKAGAFHSTVYQYATDALPGQDQDGIATISAIYGTWDALKKGDPSAGQFSFGLEARWGYGNRLTPVELGTAGIGSATGTVDPYGATQPAVVLRELFWRQGSEEKGWNYRIGKITPDRLLTSSDHIDPVSLFLPVGSGGAPSIAFPDSGLGLAAAVFPNDRFRVGIVVADANGDRTDFGDIGQGNFFKAIEAQVQLLPLTENAGYSTFTLWHTDGTDDPSDALDSSTGEQGWGFFIKLEQELTADGKNIGMIRYGRSYNEAAVYEEQGSIRYVRDDPPDPFGLSGDRFGIAASFVRPVANPFDRFEWGFDTFYRLNLVERVELTFGYQAIFRPSFNPDSDVLSIFSVRFTQFF